MEGKIQCYACYCVLMECQRCCLVLVMCVVYIVCMNGSVLRMAIHNEIHCWALSNVHMNGYTNGSALLVAIHNEISLLA